MWFRAVRKHCSGATLLAYADGELSRRKARGVKKHLSACWDCRARLQEMEQHVQGLARAVSSRNLPSGDGLAKARNRLFQRVQDYEANTALSPRFNLIETGWNTAALAASAVFLLVLVAGQLWMASPHGPPPAEDLIHQASQSEAQISTDAIQQRITVELIQETPDVLRRSWSVDIRSDENSGRFALQWKQPSGVLEYALWRAGGDREMVYRRDAGAVQARETRGSVSLLQVTAAENDLNHLQEGLMRWLEGRSWRPIFLASDFATFASQDGVILKVTEEQSATGRRFFKISARRQTGDRKVEMLMQTEATTLRPQMLSIRVTTPVRLLELRLIVEGVEPIDAARLTNALFEPDLPPFQSLYVDHPQAPGHLLRSSDTPRTGAPILPNADWLETVEMEIRYALHDARACLGEPVEIRRDPTGDLSLQGVVSTKKRKEQLLRVLIALQAPPWVKIDIKSAEEVVTDKGFLKGETSASALSISGREADVYFEQELREYFNETGTVAAERLVTAFINRAVTVSDDMVAQAWALRRLAERYGAHELRPQSGWLLKRMVRDHLEALSEHARDARLELEPVLSAIGGPPVGSGPSVAASDLPWDRTIFRLFDTVEQIRLHVMGLFAGAGLPLEVGLNARAVEIKSPQRTLDELLAALSSLEEPLQHAANIAEQSWIEVPLPPR